MIKVIATVNIPAVVFSIAAILLIPISAMLAEIFGSGLRNSMYYHGYGHLIYVLVYFGPVLIISHYVKYLIHRNDIFKLSDKNFYIFGKEVTITDCQLVQRTNIFGTRIEIFSTKKRYVFYQYMLNEPLDEMINVVLSSNLKSYGCACNNP
jgi:hypothetical protein